MTYPFLQKFAAGEQPRLFISDSSRGLLHSCARKFEFRKLYLHPRRDFGVAAELGKALHSGFQTYLVSKDEDRAIFDYMTKYPIEMCDAPMDDRSLEAGYYTLMSMINATPLLQYKIAEIKCHDDVVRPAIEVPFQIDLDGFTIPSPQGPIAVSYIGYIDTIFWDDGEQEYIVLDIKTTKRKQDDLSPIYAFDEQCVPYGLVLEYMKGGKINGFKVEYLACNIDVLNPNIQKHGFNKSQEDLDDWYRALRVDLNLLSVYISGRWFPRTGGGSSCFAFNKPCEFYDICTVRDPEIVQQIIAEEKEIIERGIAQDEAFKSKMLRDEFKPWIRFSLPMGD